MTEDDFAKWEQAYIEVQAQEGNPDAVDPLFWAIEKFWELNGESPWDCLKAILGVLRRTSNTKVIGSLAAGPLEDLIEYHGPQFIDEIEQEAKRNPRFKHLLGGVWKSSTPDVWGRVEKARGEPW